MKKKLFLSLLMSVCIFTACSAGAVSSAVKSAQSIVSSKSDASSESDKNSQSSASVSVETLSVDDVFTKRDLAQEADLTDAEYISLEDGKDVSITKAGVYVISGSASNVTIEVEAGDEDKVQIVLDGVSVTNDTSPCIYVKNADKVFVTTTESENVLKVTGTFTADGDTNTDAVIFSKDDLVINGKGTLSIESTDNAITSKDDLKITGSTINISCEKNAFEAHDEVDIYDGTINVTKCNDGIHAEDSDDDSTGSVYIAGGSFNINSTDDAIHGTTFIQIDSGNMELTAAEGIEATYITVNGGDITIAASDDGINAASKSTQLSPTFIINDGSVKITMGQGDTDGIDVNGSIYINGGTVDITGQSTFDYDGTAELNGGTVIENGKETDTITNQQFGKGGRGGFGGNGGQGGSGKTGNFGGKGGFGRGQRPDINSEENSEGNTDDSSRSGRRGKMGTPPDGNNASGGNLDEMMGNDTSSDTNET